MLESVIGIHQAIGDHPCSGYGSCLGSGEDESRTSIFAAITEKHPSQDNLKINSSLLVAKSHRLQRLVGPLSPTSDVTPPKLLQVPECARYRSARPMGKNCRYA